MCIVHEEAVISGLTKNRKSIPPGTSPKTEVALEHLGDSQAKVRNDQYKRTLLFPAYNRTRCQSRCLNHIHDVLVIGSRYFYESQCFTRDRRVAFHRR